MTTTMEAPTITAYQRFMDAKSSAPKATGRTVEMSEINPILHDWQKEIVKWAVETSRAAIWADTGLGKTFMAAEWSRLIGGTALTIAPLAVTQQTIRESAKLGITMTYVRDQSELTGTGQYITNYEMSERFNADALDAVVLDESSILKNSTGATRNQLIAQFQNVPHRLACTATPAPNDPEELTSQAEFLGRSTRVNMLAAYFVHDADGWRLKGHARLPMITWMATWALAIRTPSDMGYADGDYILPGLEIVPHLLDVNSAPDDQLFATDLGGVSGRAAIRKETLAARVGRAAELVASEPSEPWLIWCGLNDEAIALAKAIPGAVNVHGSMSPEEKAAALLGFADGDIQILITKPGIAAQGLNYQHCARMAFVGLSDSYEQYYQAIRRCYRYGQKRVVVANVILSNLEGQIARNIASKETQSKTITAALVDEMKKVRNHS
ncbi:DEAD/DEAH box helicase [Arthrobacter cryoconiti]|uniref:Helicase-related protein n=1 Tax=Arthrobacter cryoconiti TaxID=748907 RepID=A0ABV8QWG2_9MICC|nr:DEAD/DEAH box helicase [Arthrobacter cryoconiti]MCC9068829.1 SNF2-related protein [Arthrobacter cryoconiti]